VSSRLKKAWERLRELNQKIRKRRGRGHKTPDLAAERRRLRKKIKWLQEHEDPVAAADGTSTWTTGDGRKFKVAAWMVGAAPGPDGTKTNWLLRSKNKGWDGNLSSGYRSPAYSESLCRAMCGAPSCPGRCAGRSSNHSQTGPPNWGAIDVFPQYVKFGQIQREIGSPLKNELGAQDPVHYSYTGR
jgi:hypothetical protein